MPESVKFKAELLRHGTADASYLEFPFSTEVLFGKKGQVRVLAIFEGEVSYRGSLAPMGAGGHKLGVTQEIRKKTGKTFGDVVSVELWEDTEERTVEIPEDVMLLFSLHPEAYEMYTLMSYTHRKEYMRWINEAKKPETRERRKVRMIEMILAGQKGI
ncbi:YdeI/OmpD-associated family protein [Bergeyella sp. RCAD1439]|uniref:YdeI/OmpD-associated family protein n=1 Tax=Bergeyella anatis TaxID=3113737 RepID=UPI002E195997|nr:YdeI/OmpD-associated family protein [Bergeyella sp. RCAD1439]